MPHAFPEKTVSILKERAGLSIKKNPEAVKFTLYQHATSLLNHFKGYNYGFIDNLILGCYAPYEHEKIACHIGNDNCTTIVPDMYILCELFGLKPQIVQFTNLKDIEKLDEKDGNPDRFTSHSALIVDVGRKHKYLFDPFMRVFGPIIKKGKKYMQIGKSKESPSTRRIFSEFTRCSPEDFAEMMDRLHDPAESLDMLVGGQRVFTKRLKDNVPYGLKILYNDSKNTITTMLSIEQVAIQKKAVFCNMGFNDLGDVVEKSLELHVAKEFGWVALEHGKKVAEIDFARLIKLRRAVNRIKKDVQYKSRKFCRIGPLIDSDEKRESIVKIIDSIKLAEEEKKAIHPLILARTLYEFEKPGQDYVYSEEEHDSRLRGLIKKEVAGRKKYYHLRDIIYLYGWKLEKFDRNEIRRARYARDRHERHLDKIVTETNALNDFREKNKRLYRRAMDMVLFSERKLKGKSTEQLERAVSRKGLDAMTGYAAMVADFIPYIITAREHLELSLFLPDIKQKIAARMAKKNHIADSAASGHKDSVLPSQEYVHGQKPPESFMGEGI